MAEGASTSQSAEHDRVISIVEAVLLALVTVLAAWSGYSSAKWSTKSRLDLAEMSTARTQANRANVDAMETRNFDSSTFDAWFTAFTADNQPAMDLAAKRFRPEFKVAFDAWITTNPSTNPSSPPGPTFMPEYKEPLLDSAAELDAKATSLHEAGATAAGYSDDYVRITVYLASILFLTAISGHFRVRSARIGLVVVGAGILVYGVTLLAFGPKPPL